MGDNHEAEEGQETQVLAEAATYKAQAKRLMRDMQALLADRTVPASLRKEVEDVRTALRRTWKDLASEPEPEEDEAEDEGEEEETPGFRDRLRQAMGEAENPPARVKDPEFESKHDRADDGRFAKEEDSDGKGRGYVAPEGKTIDLSDEKGKGYVAPEDKTVDLTPDEAKALLDKLISGEEKASVEKFRQVWKALGLPIDPKAKKAPVEAKDKETKEKAEKTRERRARDAGRVTRKVADKAAKRKLTDEEFMVLTGQYPPDKAPAETQQYVKQLLTPDVMMVLTGTAQAAKSISRQTDAAQINRDAAMPVGRYVAKIVNAKTPGAKRLLQAAAAEADVAEADKTIDGESYPPSIREAEERMMESWLAEWAEHAVKVKVD